MALTIMVGSINVSASVDVQTLEIDQVLTRRGDTAKFDIVDATRTMTFAPLQRVTITDEAGNGKFSGYVTLDQRLIDDGPLVNHWHLECQDATYYLQKTLCNKKYQQTGVDAIAKDLLASFPPGVAVTTTNVQAGLPVLQYFNAPHLRLADAFDKLVRMANSTAFLMWDLDATNDLHFFDQNHVPAADVVLTDASPTAGGSTYGQVVYGQAVYGVSAKVANYLRDTDFYYQRDASQFANQITFRGGTTVSNAYTQTWVGNGQQTSFLFDYPPETSSQANGAMPTVTVGGGGQTVALDTGNGFGSNQALVSVAQDSQTATLRLASAPGSSVVVQATYVYDIPILQRVKDGLSVTTYGTWEEYVVDTNVKSVQAAAQRAGALLSQFASPLATAQLNVDRTYVGNLGAGQLVTLVNTQYGIDQEMIVTDCKITGQPGGGYRHQVKLAAFA